MRQFGERQGIFTLNLKIRFNKMDEACAVVHFSEFREIAKKWIFFVFFKILNKNQLNMESSIRIH